MGMVALQDDLTAHTRMDRTVLCTAPLSTGMPIFKVAAPQSYTYRSVNTQIDPFMASLPLPK